MITAMLKATVTTVLISMGIITNASVIPFLAAADELALRQPGKATKTNTFHPTDVTDKAHARLLFGQMSMMPSDDAHGNDKLHLFSTLCNRALLRRCCASASSNTMQLESDDVMALLCVSAMHAFCIFACGVAAPTMAFFPRQVGIMT